MTSELRPLRGGCQCGRNRYIISVPHDSIKEAQVLFNTEPAHQVSLATPLAAYIRVPLSWYQSTTFAFFPDETHSTIRRVYTHPSQQHAKRHFCGFCGTPLSYWSEKPMSEAEYINLTLGSLMGEDLRDLDDMGLIPDQGDHEEAMAQSPTAVTRSSTSPAVASSSALRESSGVPWFDGLVDGSRLGGMRRSQGVECSRDGAVRVEWEIVEFGSGSDVEMEESELASPGKRKMEERDE
ncbi:hypothetical protein GQ602_004918 [Ophiocordyceps camponoti-floridani]|uniref:CENP-V/GFA domain-containing protein n=1 Tax=Ophiocordyceps camponoti-floridani TaxID=2030778 RepID=A0A8H4Q4R2_9HYPO|nr:hypothetical protein GQ602_004918 [Ophiocordyceps camponoti-floridani]